MRAVPRESRGSRRGAPPIRLRDNENPPYASRTELKHFLAVLLAVGASQLVACGQAGTSPHRPGVSFHRTAAPRLPLRVGADLVVKRAQFGILETNKAGEENFVPTTVVPAEDGETFGWVVEVDTTRQSLHWQEHLRLPRPPADWGDAASDPDIVISADGRTVVAEGDDMVEDGELSRFYWALAPGDPAGDYEMDIAVEGKTVGHFAFRVPQTVREKSILVHHVPGRAQHARSAILKVARTATGTLRWK